MCFCFCAFRASGADGSAWTDYRAIMWIGDSAGKHPDKFPLFLQRLREMRINTAMVFGDGDPQPFVDAHFSYYVENMVNRGLCLKWNSNVSDWDAFVTRWAKNGRPDSMLVRDYCLDDAQWLSEATKTMATLVRKNMANRPIAYDIRDELSTTLSANPFDYDFNPITLQKFREWLKTQYASLDALNAEWDTKFASWDEVKPFTTDQIKNRMASGDAIPRGKPDWQAVEKIKFDLVEARKNPVKWNFAPWCDFRTYMDLSLANALGAIRKQARALDPATPVGIEGTQAPSAFGGYDLWRLSQSLDWVEPYDVGNAREIFASFMPGKPIITTVDEKRSTFAPRKLWHFLLEGDRGCIVWWSEDCIDWNSDDLALTPKGKTLAPVLREMTSPLASLFLRAKPVYDPIAILYSQPSIQVDWLIESTQDGSTWPRRFSSYEAANNRMIRMRDGWLMALQDLGYSPRFISSEQIGQGALDGYRVLVLPDARALSQQEMTAIEHFSTGGGTTFCNGTPGCFDEHGKLRAKPWQYGGWPEDRMFAWNDLAGEKGLYENLSGDIAAYPASRFTEKPAFDVPKAIASSLSTIAKLHPEITVPRELRARIHRYTLGAARLVAIERNIDFQMGENLKPVTGDEPLMRDESSEAKLEHPAHVYDLRSGQYLGYTDHFKFFLDPWRPSLFALLPEKIPAEKVMDYLLAQPAAP